MQIHQEQAIKSLFQNIANELAYVPEIQLYQQEMTPDHANLYTLLWIIFISYLFTHIKVNKDSPDGIALLKACSYPIFLLSAFAFIIEAVTKNGLTEAPVSNHEIFITVAIAVISLLIAVYKNHHDISAETSNGEVNPKITNL